MERRGPRVGGGKSDLVEDVFKGVGAVDGEADEDEVGLRVGEGPQAVILLLAGGIPQRQLDNLATGAMDRVRDVVLKDSRDVFLQTNTIVPGQPTLHLLPRYDALKKKKKGSGETENTLNSPPGSTPGCS